MKAASPILALLAAMTVIGTPALGVGGGPVSRGVGAFGGYNSSPAPQTRQYTIRPRRPVFGPTRSAPPTRSRPTLSPNQVNPRLSTPSHNFRDQNLRRLDPPDRNIWSHGRWHHRHYRGRYGWWWFVAGYGYWYEESYFPYPDYISDEIEQDMGDETPPDATPPNDLQGDTYYYCSSPDGYFPHVATCSVSWEAVPAAPTH